jgi:hypothetical protein
MPRKNPPQFSEPSRDRLLTDLRGLSRKLNKCVDDARWEKAEEIDSQIELLMQLAGSRFSPIILDAANARARLAIINRCIDVAEIHVSFVSDVCLNRPSGEWTTQFADCLECASRVAMARKDWELFGFCLEKCAEIRARVLGTQHPDSLRAAREWEMFLDVMTDPSLDGSEANQCR